MSTPRPDQLVVVIGTGTDVGKTWVSDATLRALRGRGLTVAARKPAQSFAPDDTNTDADVLGAATGEAPTVVCPAHRWYDVPMAPPMAAEVLNRPRFTIRDLIAEITWPTGIDVGLIESAGGVRSPLAANDGDAVTLIAALMPDAVVLVADAGLGTINAVRLAIAAIEPLIDTRNDLDLIVVLNRFDGEIDLHRRNHAWLQDHDGLTVVTSPDALVTLLTDGTAPDHKDSVAGQEHP
jgi:dethiobiotin synthetase